MKKTILILVALMVAVSAHAGFRDIFKPRPMVTADSSWNTISRDSRVIYQLPQYALSRGFFVRASGVCIEGDQIRTKKKVTKCVEWRGGENDRCVREESFYATADIEGTGRYCSRRRGGENNDCVEWTEYDYTLELEHMVPVYRRVRGGRDNDDFDRSRMSKPLFKKELNVPFCE